MRGKRYTTIITIMVEIVIRALTRGLTTIFAEVVSVVFVVGVSAHSGYTAFIADMILRLYIVTILAYTQLAVIAKVIVIVSVGVSTHSRCSALIAVMVHVVIITSRNYDSAIITAMFTFALYVRNAGINAAAVAKNTTASDKLSLAHVDAFKKEMADAGIQTDKVSPKLLPNYTKQKDF